MSIRETIKDFIPPIIFRSIKNALRYQRTYISYTDALKASSSSLGYEDPYLVKAVYEETKEFISGLEKDFTMEADLTLVHSIIPFCFLNGKKTINIIDIGGACGIHYFSIHKLFNKSFKFNWRIVETKAICDISKDLENEDLSFFNNLEDAYEDLKKIDLIIASGAIQYFEDPKSILSKIINIGADYILLTRLSLSQEEFDIISVQRSLLSQNSFEILPAGFKDRILRYPHTNMSEAVFLNTILTKYKVKLHLQDTSGLQIINNFKCTGYGVLLEKITEY